MKAQLFRGDIFTWTKGIGTIESSDIIWPGCTGLEGFSVRSHKTGVVKNFSYAGKNVSLDGDVIYLVYISTDGKTEIRIYND